MAVERTLIGFFEWRKRRKQNARVEKWNPGKTEKKPWLHPIKLVRNSQYRVCYMTLSWGYPSFLSGLLAKDMDAWVWRKKPTIGLNCTSRDVHIENVILSKRGKKTQFDKGATTTTALSEYWWQQASNNEKRNIVDPWKTLRIADLEATCSFSPTISRWVLMADVAQVNQLTLSISMVWSTTEAQQSFH